MHVSFAPSLAVASLVWQPRPEAFMFTVICKATYTLRHGVCPLVARPEAPLRADLYWQEGRGGSLRTPTDLAPFKRGVDVLLAGSAYAASGQPTRSLVARFAVGTAQKAIAVHGDRVWLPDGRISEPIPFTKMPLRWERAAGGPATWNPVGIPDATQAYAPSAGPLPNLEPVGFTPRSQTQAIPPIGFGPLAPHWPTRATHLRQHGAAWSHDAWHERPLPTDVDAAYFNAAPPDQQLDQLPAQIQILLEHLHPEIPRLVAEIEDICPRALVNRGGAKPQELAMRCDTLFVDTDRGTCSLTWRATTPLKHREEEGVVVVAPTRRRAASIPPARAPEPAPIKVEEAKEEETRPHIQALSLSTAAPLPFQPAKPVEPIFADEETRTIHPELLLSASTPLPFLPATPIELGVEETRTIHPELLLSASTPLPFQPTAPIEPEPRTEPPPSMNLAPTPPFVALPAPTPLFALATSPAATPLRTTPLEDRGPSRAERAAAQPRKPSVSVEQYARIKGELWGAHAALQEVLARHGVDEIEWRVHERRQADALAAEAREGRCDLALSLVAAFEASQVPVTQVGP